LTFNFKHNIPCVKIPKVFMRLLWIIIICLIVLDTFSGCRSDSNGDSPSDVKEELSKNASKIG